MMGPSITEVLEFVAQNDVHFVRLAFCDLFGVQKHISLHSGELARAFEHGVRVDMAAFDDFVVEEDADILLFPDPSTLSVLPWRPSHSGVVRLFCRMRRSDGSPCQGDGRSLLQQAQTHAGEMGYSVKIGTECEFYLFELDDMGQPTRRPHDNAGYCDIAPLDRGENIRREICLALAEMRIPQESSHHERGPGQNEIVCKYVDALEAADNLITLKSVSEITASMAGLSASFLPKPLPEKDGSSLHTSLSLEKEGKNLFLSGTDLPEAEGFMAGVYRRLRELTLFLNPLASSYARFDSDIPRAITLSRSNRAQVVRIPGAQGYSGRMELRSPDPSLNPYFAFALLIEAGLEGVRESAKLPPEDTIEEANQLPSDLKRAVQAARESDFVARVIPPKALEQICSKKEAEYSRWKKQQAKSALADIR